MGAGSLTVVGTGVSKLLTHQREYFISGKFDLFKRHISYASLIQAFRSLVLHLLTESEAATACHSGMFERQVFILTGDVIETMNHR